jgi:hypothetical protein
VRACSSCRPASPDLNPIEQFFAKLKALLRTAARRTIDGLCNAIGSALDAFSPDQCRNHIANSGYSHSQENGSSRLLKNAQLSGC